MKHSIAVLLLITALLSCRAKRDLFGTYQSNFAVNGYFIQQVKLNPDSTLEFRYWGDLVFDTATAHFRLTGNRLSLIYYPIKIDTSSYSELRKQGITLMDQSQAKLGQAAPFGLQLKNGNLFLTEDNFVVVKRKPNSKGKFKKYFLIRVQ